MDLYRELQAITPAQFQYLLQDLFERNTFWELETERASAQQTEAATWQVTLDVRARKVVVDEAGVETEVPMDDWLEVGVLDEDEPSRQKFRIRSGKQTITVTVPQKPARAGGNIVARWQAFGGAEVHFAGGPIRASRSPPRGRRAAHRQVRRSGDE